MFEKKNGEIISRIKTARDKLYAHIDLNWQEFAKQISFKDIESCIEFLNKILDINLKYDIIFLESEKMLL